jgi:hypothetical protein
MRSKYTYYLQIFKIVKTHFYITSVLREQDLQNQQVHPKEHMWMEQCCFIFEAKLSEATSVEA